MQLSAEQVRHIAHLARLATTPEQEQQYAQQLTAILNYVDALQQVDTTGVEPTAQVTGLENVTRPDVVMPSEIEAALLACASATQDNQIKVQTILTEK